MQKIVVLQTPSKSKVGQLYKEVRMIQYSSRHACKRQTHIRNKAVAKKALNIAFQTLGWWISK